MATTNTGLRVAVTNLGPVSVRSSGVYFQKNKF